MFRRKKKMRLGEILIEQGVLSQDALEHALEKQKKEGGLLGELLLKMGLVKEEDIVIALAYQFNYPYLPVQNCEISSKVIALVPVELAKKFLFIPIDKISDVLTIIMADPTNEHAKEEIAQVTGLRLQVLVGTVTEINTALRKYYKIKDSLIDSLKPEENISRVSFQNIDMHSNEDEKPLSGDA